MFSSKISAYSKVRDRVLKIQRELAKNNNAILEGRDIGTIVLPNADIKIFMTASQEERAKRRFEQLKLTDKSISFEKVLQDLKQRDFNDENREVAPLKPACDSIIIDNTGLNLKQTVEKCIEIINEKLHKNKGAWGNCVFYFVNFPATRLGVSQKDKKRFKKVKKILKNCWQGVKGCVNI